MKSIFDCIKYNIECYVYLTQVPSPLQKSYRGNLKGASQIFHFEGMGFQFWNWELKVILGICRGPFVGHFIFEDRVFSLL